MMEGQQKLSMFLTDQPRSGAAHTMRGSKSMSSLTESLGSVVSLELDELSASGLTLESPVASAFNETLLNSSPGPGLSILTPSSHLTTPLMVRQTRSATVLSDPSDHEDQALQTIPGGLRNADPDDPNDWWDLSNEEDEIGLGFDTEKSEMAEQYTAEAQEAWEDELDELMNNSVDAERDWTTIRTEVDEQLKKNFTCFGQTDVNQLIILRSFATLIIKGYGKVEASKRIAEQWREGEGTHFARRVRALARHYRIFGKLLAENRGGAQKGHSNRGTSLLLNEAVEAHCRAWLTDQKLGTVTPTRFARGLEDEIFPELGITPLRPLTERTAQRWLIRLGWRHSTI
jgi:hypothetical protein